MVIRIETRIYERKSGGEKRGRGLGRRGGSEEVTEK
jgi:hypothetical protein